MIRSRAQAPLSLPIETPRLLLRDFRKSDVDAVHAYSALPEVARFMIWGRTPRPKAARQWKAFWRIRRRVRAFSSI